MIIMQLLTMNLSSSSTVLMIPLNLMMMAFLNLIGVLTQ
jgi:hypothetical protein